MANWQQERRVRFQVGAAFYRAHSQSGRDLAVLAAALYRRCHGQLRVLDAMSGSGVRPLRYCLEAKADWVWANEGNPELLPLLRQNLGALPEDRYHLTQLDANEVFFRTYSARDYYDLVDVDNFGGPMPYGATALWAVKLGGLLYLTSTDGRATSGRDGDRSLQTYGAYARAHPAAHEQGLRLMIGLAVQQGAARGLGLAPVFSFFNGQVHRVMLRLRAAPRWDSQHYGFVGYCHGCGQFHTVGWRQLNRVRCGCGSDPPPVLSGPQWLGPLHDGAMLKEMRELAQAWGWQDMEGLLATMAAEAEMPPYYYPLGEIGRRGAMDIPRRERLIEALQQQGFRASATHLQAQAIKTDAGMGECVAIAKSLP